MRILLDECVHSGVKEAFRGHSVKTVSEIGWRSSQDTPLLTYAQGAFDVFVTIDRKMELQHNLKKLRLGILIARVPSNEISSYQPIFDELRKAAETIQPGQVIHIYSPSLSR